MVIPAGPYAWDADASRQLENFTDFGHFPWVHPGLLGDPERPVVPDYTVDTDGHVLHYDIVRPEAPNSDDFPVFGNEQAEAPGAPQPLPAAPAVHDRAAARLGRGEGDGVLLRIPTGRARTSASASGDRPKLRLRPARQVLQAFEDTIFNQDKRDRRVPAARAGAVRPRRRDAPQVRRGGGGLPPGDARERPGQGVERRLGAEASGRASGCVGDGGPGGSFGRVAVAG